MTRPPFTARTVAVVELIAAGVPRREIAARLGVGEGVVWRESRHARRCLHARNEASLVNRAIRAGVITAEPGTPAPLERSLIVTLEMVAAGCSNAEIAARLWLSVDGVKFRLTTILARLDARDRAHAVAVGWQRGILRDQPHHPHPDNLTRKEFEAL